MILPDEINEDPELAYGDRFARRNIVCYPLDVIAAVQEEQADFTTDFKSPLYLAVTIAVRIYHEALKFSFSFFLSFLW